MILGKWYRRTEGQWRVWRSEFVLWRLWPVTIRGYQWTADSSRVITVMRSKWLGDVEVNPWEEGHTPWAFLARRRAIAALRRMGGAK